jgi:hypothetical protein
VRARREAKGRRGAAEKVEASRAGEGDAEQQPPVAKDPPTFLSRWKSFGRFKWC